ncbi:MAG: hypothetical protein Q7K34_04270 [archaeon]|nr:hypothetical protein [archaeon]
MPIKKETVLSTLKVLRESSQKRNFAQSVDFTMNFKGLDFKKPENRIDVSVKLPYGTGKASGSKSLVFVSDKAFAEQIKTKASKVIMLEDIPAIKGKDVEQLIRDYDVFLAEGPAMLAVAKHMGQQLAPKGRMPRLIQPNLKTFDEEATKSSALSRVSNKKGKFMPLVHVLIGKENDSDDHLAENIVAVYNSLVAALPGKEQNIKSVQVKFTMSAPMKITDKPQGAGKRAVG